MPATATLADPSTRPLSEVARHLIVPTGIIDTLWFDLEDLFVEWGDKFDPWQDGLGQLILGLRADGSFAATIGGVSLSIPRQVAKTFIVGRIVFALCARFPGTTALWSAHHTRTSTQTFEKLKGFARRPAVQAHLAGGRNRGLRDSHGEQEVRFANDSVIMFGARAQGFGRGFDEVDIEVFDEAQILAERTLEDMVAATNQSRFPHGALLFFMGTPPRPVDPGEAFTARRAEALSGKSEDALYVECSADDDCDPDDRDQWVKANPSFPHRTPLQSMLRLRKNLTSEDAWRREALGIWDSTAVKGVLPGPPWADQADGTSVVVDSHALGVEVGPDLAWASTAVAGRRVDGGWHIELDDDQHTRGRGTEWLVPHVEHIVEANPQLRAVVADVAGPIRPLLVELNGRWFLKSVDGRPGVEVHPLRVAELGAGCAMVLSGIVTGTLWHLGQPQLTSAALSAGKRALGDTGMWVWSRRSSTSDITPIQAATYALIGAQAEQPRQPSAPLGRGTSSNGRRGVIL